MWDYSEKVMDHYRNPRNVGKIDNADAVGIAGSLSCGDQLKIYLKIENGIVTPTVGMFYRIIAALGMRVEIVKPMY